MEYDVSIPADSKDSADCEKKKKSYGLKSPTLTELCVTWRMDVLRFTQKSTLRIIFHSRGKQRRKEKKFGRSQRKMRPL